MGNYEHARTGSRDVWGFVAFSHGWTWTFWIVAALWGVSVCQMPATVFFVIGGAGVALGGFVMSRVTYGPAGLRDLGRRLADPSRIGAAWWAAVLLLYPALTLAAAGLALALNATAQPLELTAVAARLTNPLGLMAMMGLILIIGPLPEEIGWRGYLLDRLQVRWTALTASLVLGLVWWFWHLPRFVLPGYFDAFGRAAPSPFDFLYGILPSAVVYTWVYNNTRRSVLGGIILHFMQNFTGEFLGIAEEARPIRLALEVGFALALIAWWGLWRGMYVQVFPGQAIWAWLYPSLGFALWHIAPQSVTGGAGTPGGTAAFVIVGGLFGLSWGWVAYRSGSIRWPSFHTC